jgi:UDPglucose--hexose-1-phosphate uridylyltransferase
VLAYRDGSASNTPGWKVRVVPNRFPAADVHEVIIESPDHTGTLATMQSQQLEQVLSAWRQRILDLRSDARLRYVHIFKNHGSEGGASLEHPHSQLTGLPMVPRDIEDELAGGLRYFERNARCIYCDHVHDAGFRMVLATERHVAITPYAARFPFETWILPRAHASHFESEEPASLIGLACILGQTLRMMDRALRNPSFNLFIHTAPLHENPMDHYHWHIEIMPRLAKVGGFEWGTGVYINETTPEQAANALQGSNGVTQ